MTEKRKPAISCAVSLKPQGNERYGETIGTLKLYPAKYNGDLTPEQLAKLPKYTGFVIIDEKLAQDAIVDGRGEGKSKKILLNVAGW